MKMVLSMSKFGLFIVVKRKIQVEFKIISWMIIVVNGKQFGKSPRSTEKIIVVV